MGLVRGKTQECFISTRVNGISNVTAKDEDTKAVCDFYNTVLAGEPRYVSGAPVSGPST